MSDVLLILHVLAAGAWFGGNIAQFVASRHLTRDGGHTAAAWMETAVSLGGKLYMPAGIVALVTGFGLIGVSEGAWGYADPFVIVGIAMVVVGAALSMAVFAPKGRAAAEAFAAGDDATGQAQLRTVAAFGTLDTLLLVVTFTAMVMKWGA